MLSNYDKNIIEELINNKKIIYSKLLSDSFGINCVKFSISEGENFIVKYYNNNNKKDFNAIKVETKNLIFLNNLCISLFPKVFASNDRYLIMSFINHNNDKPKNTKQDLLKAIVDVHSNFDNKFGFIFDTQIGGLKQINSRGDNWVDFFRDKRLGYIYELISFKNAMDLKINKKIDFLLNNLENFIPKKPKASLLHGDLWEGNILFDNQKFVSFIDPGSFYGHNELEIAYLRWFNPSFIDDYFLENYSNYIKVDEEYLNYEAIYQLYYSLLNVYLWDRQYINDVQRLLNKLKI